MNIRTDSCRRKIFILLALFAAVSLGGCAEGVGGAYTPSNNPYASMIPVGKPIRELLAISSHISKNSEYSWTREFEIEKLAEAGTAMLRTDFSWSRIEPADGEWRFEGYDVMVDECLAAGIRIDALLDYGVDWAMPEGSHDEIDPEVWADYTGTVASHFSDRIDLYEIWNEQNIDRFWKPSPNPCNYGDLLRAGYEAIHANDPEAVVLFGGLSSHNGSMFGPDGLWSFLVQVGEHHPDVCDLFDGMAIHPYTILQQTGPESDLHLGVLRFPSITGAVDEVRDLLEKVGCPDKPIYLTEMGWPSLLIGRERQGAYLARGLMLASSKEVDTYFWYTFWDGDGDAIPPTEDFFGLFTWPGEEPQAKPAYEALLGINLLLGDARYAGDLGAALQWDGGRHGLAFVDESGLWTVGLWRNDEGFYEPVETQVPLHPDANGQWELYDQAGSLLEAGDDQGDPVTVPLCGSVKYLRFSVTHGMERNSPTQWNS